MTSSESYRDTCTLVYNEMGERQEQVPNQFRPYQYGREAGFFNPASAGQHTVQMTTVQPEFGGPTMITQPMENGVEPETTCTLVASVMGAALCFLWCGLFAILTTWQARLQVLDRKFAHARHSLAIAKTFLCIALFFGVIFWGILIWYLITLTRVDYY